MATHTLDALAAQTKHLPTLRLGRDLDARGAVECRDLDLAAERCGGEGHGHLAVQVVVVALEDGVVLDVDDHIQVAGRTAVHAMFAFAREADAVALVDTGRNLDRQRLVRLDAPCAVAGAAGVLDLLAVAVAHRAGLLDAEEALLHAHLAVALAGTASDRLRTRLGAGAAAGAALLHGRHAQLRLGAARGLLERDLEVVAQVGAAVHIAATAARLAEDVAEDVAEGIGKIGAAARAAPTAHRRIDAGMPELVVGGALLPVGEHLVGLLGLLEALLRLGVVRVAVRVELHGQLAVGLLDLILGRIPVHPEHVVVVTLCHLLGHRLSFDWPTSGRAKLTSSRP